jgi:hypothetical protein
MTKPLAAASAAIALCLAGALAGCPANAEKAAQERKTFVERCGETCASRGFTKGKVAETTVVGGGVLRECYCVSGDVPTPEPIFTEESGR